MDSGSIREALEKWFEDCECLTAQQAELLADALLERKWTSSDDLTANWGMEFLVSHADDTECSDGRLRAFLEAEISLARSIRVVQRARSYLLTRYRDSSQIEPLVRLSLQYGPDESIEAMVALQHAHIDGIPEARDAIARLLAEPTFAASGYSITQFKDL